jgi:S-adenosylmethionine synthetase
MGIRVGSDLRLTVAMPLLEAYVESEGDYIRRNRRMLEALQAQVDSNCRALRCVHVELNTLDVPGRGMAGLYLSVLGTSAEDGDSG